MLELDHIFHARGRTKLNQKSSLSRATGRAEEGSKNGLRSDLRVSNLKNVPWGSFDPLAAAYFHTQSHTLPDQFNFAFGRPA